MVSEVELYQKLAAVWNHDLSLAAFEDWFSVATWNAHKDSAPAAMRLVGVIELALAEFSIQHLTYAELMREFEAILRREQVLTTSSSNTTIRGVFHIGVSPSPQPSNSLAVQTPSRRLLLVPAIA